MANTWLDSPESTQEYFIDAIGFGHGPFGHGPFGHTDEWLDAPEREEVYFEAN
jgi:dGTP triphosphohydrolase